MKHFATSTFLALVLATTACAGNPDVPEEQKSRDYASTKSDPKAEDTPEMTPMESGDTGAPKASGPVATVNGKPISADEFNVEIERGVAKGMAPGILRQFKDQIVDQLIDRTLIEGAIDDANISVKDTEIDAKMEEVRAEFAKASAAMGQESSLEAATAQMGITAEELRESIEQAIAIEKILETRGFKAPDAKATKKFYEDNKPQFERPEQVHLRHILVKVDGADDDKAAWDAGEKRAQMVHAEVTKKNADFGKIATEKSEGPAAQNGGDLGPRPRGVLPEEVDKVAFSMKKGEISKPVKSPFGYHILKLEDRNDAGVVPYEEIADELQARMKNDAVNQALVGMLEELRKKAKIEKHPDNVN